MIIDLDTIKLEVGREDGDHDALLDRKLTEAEAIVIDYLKVPADEYDVAGENDFPTVVAAAVILVTRNLYEDPDGPPISQAVESLLHRLRDPAMA